MSDTELTVSQPIVITVAVERLDFNGVVAAIQQAAAAEIPASAGDRTAAGGR